jgi:hypothetical protein
VESTTARVCRRNVNLFMLNPLIAT